MINIKYIIYFLFFLIIVHFLLYFFNFDIFDLFDKNNEKINNVEIENNIKKIEDSLQLLKELSNN